MVSPGVDFVLVDEEVALGEKAIVVSRLSSFRTASTFWGNKLLGFSVDYWFAVVAPRAGAAPLQHSSGMPAHAAAAVAAAAVPDFCFSVLFRCAVGLFSSVFAIAAVLLVGTSSADFVFGCSY